MGIILLFFVALFLPNPAQADATRVTLRADALTSGYTVVHSTGTVWLGLPQQAVKGTHRVKVKIAPVQKPEKYMLNTVEPLTDIYRFTLNSQTDFTLRKKLKIKMAYPAADVDDGKIFKYWDYNKGRWRRLHRAEDNTDQFQITATIQKKQAIVAVFPKPVSEDIVQGYASWYDWTGAACNAFPLGSIIRVTNVATGDSVESEVVSTGPFVPGRVVDLTREQFSQIADLSAGVVEVTVQRIQ